MLLVPDLLTLHSAGVHAAGKLASWHSVDVHTVVVVGTAVGDVEDEDSVAVRVVGNNAGAGMAGGAEDEVKVESVVAVESVAIPALICATEAVLHNVP